MSLMEQYLKEEKINELSEATLYNLRSFFSIANGFKPPEHWSKDDMDSYILTSQRLYKKGTVELQKRRLKKFFKWAGKESIVSHIKVKDMKTTLKSDDILTIEEINKLIETTESPM